MVYHAGVGRHLIYNMQKDPHIIVARAKSLYALEWLYLPSCALPRSQYFYSTFASSPTVRND
jgi:hypothetical protein